ncbi:hypothetical protein VTJ04DRAFT_57 [Mycothermus thermophilus]|uniref:uncharacterized protein n=1 Tax=Humicola insolens TaxID=85995 RepID=UPI003743BCA9
MDNHPDLQGLPSDAFDADFDLENQGQADHNHRSFSSQSPSPSPSSDEEPQRVDEDLNLSDFIDDDADHPDYDFEDLNDFDSFGESDHHSTDSESDEEEHETDEDDQEEEADEEEDEDEGLGFGDFRHDYDWGSDSEAEPVPEAQRLEFHRRNFRELSNSIEDLLDQLRRGHEAALNFVEDLHSEVRRDHSLRLLNDVELEDPNPRHRQQNQQQQHRNMPQNAESRRRARRGHARFADELVEMEVQPVRAGSRAPANSRPQQPEVIDLTVDSDQDDEPQILQGPRPSGAGQAAASGRNPRRQSSRPQRTPSLARSDGSILGNTGNVIDLTLDDSSDGPPQPIPLPRREPVHLHNRRAYREQGGRFRPSPHDNRQPHNPQPDNQNQPHGGFVSPFARFAGLLSGFDLVRQFGGFGRNHPDLEIQFLGHLGINNNLENPIADNIPNLNYHVPVQVPPPMAPKPPHQPPPAPRDGFTRNTGDPDMVIVCPGCDKELKYDPELKQEGGRPRAQKKARNRKEFEEHHFWALKECGHVYCKDCYEGRKYPTKTPNFKRKQDQTRKTTCHCAVDGCDSEVSTKSNWVGLFV